MTQKQTRDKKGFSDITDFPQDCFCSASVNLDFGNESLCPPCHHLCPHTDSLIRLFMHPDDDYIMIFVMIITGNVFFPSAG